MELYEFTYTSKDLIILCPTQGEKDNEAQVTRQQPGVKSNPACGATNIMAKCDEKEYEEVPDHSLTVTGDKRHAANFDETLKKLWREAQLHGVFRYSLLNGLPSKVLPGKYNFIAQLNPDRGVKRRKPQPIQSTNQPFNPEEFNFNKVKDEELLMKWRPWWCETVSRTHPEGSSNNDGKADDSRVDGIPVSVNSELNEKTLIEHFVLINVSPLEYGHVLLTPFLKLNQPQKITFDGLRMAVEMVLLNASRDFRVGFNSLCGYASVNHHHYHAYYLNHRLHIETQELHCLMGPCKEIRNYPAPGFSFILDKVEKDYSIESFIGNAFKLVSYLQEMNVAHNVFITRGSTVNSSDHCCDAVRLFIWARAPSYGSKECEAFNPALCELAGHFPIKNERSYELLTEATICDELERICRETFTNIRQAVSSLYMSELPQ